MTTKQKHNAAAIFNHLAASITTARRNTRQIAESCPNLAVSAELSYRLHASKTMRQMFAKHPSRFRQWLVTQSSDTVKLCADEGILLTTHTGALEDGPPTSELFDTPTP